MITLKVHPYSCPFLSILLRKFANLAPSFHPLLLVVVQAPRSWKRHCLAPVARAIALELAEIHHLSPARWWLGTYRRQRLSSSLSQPCRRSLWTFLIRTFLIRTSQPGRRSLMRGGGGGRGTAGRRGTPRQNSNWTFLIRTFLIRTCGGLASSSAALDAMSGHRSHGHRCGYRRRRGRSRWRGRRSPAGSLAWREIEGNRSHCIGQRRDHNVLVIVLRVGRAHHHRKVLC